MGNDQLLVMCVLMSFCAIPVVACLIGELNQANYSFAARHVKKSMVLRMKTHSAITREATKDFKLHKMENWLVHYVLQRLSRIEVLAILTGGRSKSPDHRIEQIKIEPKGHSKRKENERIREDSQF